MRRSITPDTFFIGGESIYKQALEYAHTIYITEILKEYEGDAYFPDYDKTKYVKTILSEHNEFRFVRYDRVTK